MVICTPFLTMRLLAKGRGLSHLVYRTPSVLTCVAITNHNTIQHTNFHTSSRDCDTELNTEEAKETICDPSLPVIPRRFNLTFEEYIKEKHKLRNKQRVAGFICGFGSMVACSVGIQTNFPEWFIPAATPEEIPLVFGMDPMIISVASTMVSGICGASVGFGVLKQSWALLNRTAWNNLQARETDFLRRLDQHRFVGDSNFEDDFYGESIKNLSDYRQWIRQHQKKRETHAKFNPPK